MLTQVTFSGLKVSLRSLWWQVWNLGQLLLLCVLCLLRCLLWRPWWLI
ncbi:rCG52668 [Rattus norvegicus]|uniref:RCG52668 n=1 Tax=Rattus norvegicus TaxID=10116 RepID=A6IRP4_RAT|nr:rCG52668 [Rattus norvegicus]